MREEAPILTPRLPHALTGDAKKLSDYVKAAAFTPATMDTGDGTNLKAALETMADLASGAIHHAILALKHNDPVQARTVIEGDRAVDALEVGIEEHCLKILDTNRPSGRQMRFLVAGLKINVELERIADLAVDIATEVQALHAHPRLIVPAELYRLTGVSLGRVRQSLQAYTRQDEALARKVILMETTVKRLASGVHRTILVKHLVRTGRPQVSAVSLLLINRILQRVCDHAENIAEDVIYMLEDRIVRHRHETLG